MFPNDLSLERDKRDPQILPRSAPQVLAHKSVLSVCLPGSIPRISDPFPSISAHRVYLLRPQKDVALSGLPPGSQTGVWFYFLIPRDGMGYLEILSKCS